MSDIVPETQPRELVLSLSSNDKNVKLSRFRGGRWTKPLLQLDADTLRRRSKRIRDALNELTKYSRENPQFALSRDPDWSDYRRIMTELQEAGEGLKDSIIDDGEQAKALDTLITELPHGSNLIVHCSDGDVTLPIGFIYDGSPRPVHGPPSRAHFAGFWLSRLKITLLVQNGGCEEADLSLDPDTFQALYALHKDEFDRAKENIQPAFREKLRRLLSLPLKEHYDWTSATQAWDAAGNLGNILFVLAHSDGDMLILSDSKLDSGSFSKRFTRPEAGPATLLLLNCCLSATGARGDSLLSAVARPGFSGLVGTEAEILNTQALQCGAHLLWDLCAEGLTLGEALENLQKEDDPDFFPASLYYTCYADRNFALKAPIRSLWD